MPDNTHDPVSLSPPTAPINVIGTPKDDALDEEKRLAKEELKRISPPKEELRKFAAKCGPLPKWLDKDEPLPTGVPENGKPETGDEEELAKQELAKTMPSKARLRELAKKNPPLPDWFDEEEEAPF